MPSRDRVERSAEGGVVVREEDDAQEVIRVEELGGAEACEGWGETWAHEASVWAVVLFVAG